MSTPCSSKVRDSRDHIEEIVNSFPRAILAKDSEDRNIFQLAVIKRHENVFNLLYQMGEYKQYITRLEDDNENTLLHLVGNQAPIEKLNVVPGAALQMQRKLQWFKVIQYFFLFQGLITDVCY
ncbi:unnamed protein product [Camellia sinensis]